MFASILLVHLHSVKRCPGLLVSSAAEMLGTFVLVWHLRPRGRWYVADEESDTLWGTSPYPTWGSLENHRLKSAFFEGYVSSREGRFFVATKQNNSTSTSYRFSEIT